VQRHNSFAEAFSLAKEVRALKSFMVGTGFDLISTAIGFAETLFLIMRSTSNPVFVRQ